MNLDKINFKEADIPINHTFCNGMYSRAIRAKAGTLLVGYRHKVPCINILAQGKLLVKFGDKKEVLEAPHIFNTKAGEKKVVFVLEDVTFINVFKTDVTDIKKLEEILIQKGKDGVGSNRSNGGISRDKRLVSKQIGTNTGKSLSKSE